MDFTIASILGLDGLTNGAIYALLGRGAGARVHGHPRGVHPAGRVRRLRRAHDGHHATRPGAGHGLVAAVDDGGGRRHRTAGWPPAQATDRTQPQGHRAVRLVSAGGVPRDLGARTAEAFTAGPGPADAGPRHADRAADLPPGLPFAGRFERAGAADRLGRRALRTDGPRAALLRCRRLPHPGVLGSAVLARTAVAVGADADHLPGHRRADRRDVRVLRPHAQRQGACARRRSTATARA